VLNTLANGAQAIVSRGELVEIGGSFRVPDIMAKSGATLVEVGTTNRTRVDDYQRAIGPDTGAIVKVHRSNFAVEGFVAEATVQELAAITEPRAVPVVHDLGSGLLLSLDDYGLSSRAEPTAGDAVNAGAAVVTMSGDKMLGGPQAGIILARRDIASALRANPLARAFRVDKLTLAALEATLALYRDPPRALREIPALAQITTPVIELRERATRIFAAVQSTARDVRLVESSASVGGGAFPTARIPSVALSFGGKVEEMERRLRLGETTVVARIADGRLVVDLRTIPPSDDAALTAALRLATQ
jgi:L-seryl-tRNA(Ser) seleniumtransferase